MRIHEDVFEDVTVLTLKGKLMGGKETNAVQEHVQSLIDGGARELVMDLSRVKWLNSQGVGMLMACLTKMRNAGGSLVISGATEKVENVFMVTKLIQIFETFDSVEEAIQSFKKMVHA